MKVHCYCYFFTSFLVLIITAIGIYSNYFSLDYYHCRTTVLPFYTHIIVGGGTTGCVLAAKLSENQNNSVLLVEAGQFFNIFSTIPLLATLFQLTKYDWSYKTVPQLWAAKGLQNRISFWPRGKGVGGSGQINFMIHGELDPEDLNKWEEMGLVGIRNIRKYYKSFEDKTFCKSTDYLYETLLHKKCFCKKYFKKTKKRIFETDLQYSELSKALFTAVKELNIPALKFLPSVSAIKNGRRWSSFESHLLDALLRPNLHILCNTETKKIIFNKNHQKAIGILATSVHNKKYKIYGTSHIIIAAGAINSPKLLMSSGIGNRTELIENGIKPPIRDLPGVGKNLHDHLNVPIFVSLQKRVSGTLNKILHPFEIWKYITTRKGLIGTSPISGFVYSSRNISVTLFGVGSTDEKLLKEIANYKTETFRNLFPFYYNKSQEGFSFLVACPQPKSRGFIKLHNSSQILINPQYLSNSEDINCIINGINLIVPIINTTLFKKMGAKVHWPELAECKNYKNKNYFECLIKHVGITGYHPGGTCKMGNLVSDARAVVNNKFQVKGIKNLYIVDASVLPTPVSTFPNSILISMAEYAADLIATNQT